MSKEFSPESLVVAEVNSFLKEKYPVKSADVAELLEDLHNEAKTNSRYEVVSKSIDLTIEFAKEGGIKNRNTKVVDILYVPARLSAISKFEKETGSNLDKFLPLSRHLGILAIGEITSIGHCLHQGWRSDSDQIAERLSNFKKLLSLQSKLIKTSNLL